MWPAQPLRVALQNSGVGRGYREEKHIKVASLPVVAPHTLLICFSVLGCIEDRWRHKVWITIVMRL